MRIISCLFCIVSVALPASVTLTTTCSSSSQTVTGGSSCRLSDGVGYGEAQASGSFAISGNTLTVNAYVNASAAPGTPPPAQFYAPFSASSTVAIAADLYTTGPLRQGYVVMSGTSQTTDGGVGGGNVSYSIGSALSLDCPVNRICSNGQYPNLMPIELGTSFTFSNVTTASGQSDIVEFQGDGLALTADTFTFFEADGVTPVSVFDADPTAVPEAGSCSLLFVSFASLVGILRPRKTVG